MPLDVRAALQIGLLLAALPAQYLVTMYMSSTKMSREFALQDLIASALTVRDKYLSWDYWQQLCLSLIKDVHYTDADDQDESPAVEVLKFRGGDKHFAYNLEPRSPRPASVFYRVGQVIKHKLSGYRGVIVGWDSVAKAPESWIADNHPADKPHWRKLPHYSVLVDTRDRSEPQMTYVAQENIQIVINVKVIHPDIDDYFEGYDGAQYLPRPWLRHIYPHD